jgi:hypothetical protein
MKNKFFKALPDVLRLENNANKFKTKLKSFLIERCLYSFQEFSFGAVYVLSRVGEHKNYVNTWIIECRYKPDANSCILCTKTNKDYLLIN